MLDIITDVTNKNILSHHPPKLYWKFYWPCTALRIWKWYNHDIGALTIFDSCQRPMVHLHWESLKNGISIMLKEENDKAQLWCYMGKVWNNPKKVKQ
jgi:hypothetical protein